MQKARENGISPQQAASFCFSDHWRINFGKQQHISQPVCAEDCWKKSGGKHVESHFVMMLSRATGLCMQTAIGTEMSEWLTLGPCMLKIDSGKLTQYCGFTIKGNSNSGISWLTV